MSIHEAFNNTVEYYDNWIRRAIPDHDSLFRVAGELIPFGREEAIDVLDLGAGTGLFSLQVLESYPRARFVLYDVAGKMLDLARERFSGHSGRFRYVVEDYRGLSLSGSFDLVISSFSIHHLEDDEKRDLFGRIFRALRDPGLFLNIDLIKGATPWLEELYCTRWYEKMRLSGATEEEVRAGIERRLAFDRDALLEDQLRWLKEAGFRDADCPYRSFKMGLFAGFRKGGGR